MELTEIKKRKINYKQLAMVSIVVLASLISVLFDYISAGFDASSFATAGYWIKFFTINTASVLIILVMRSYSKDREFSDNADINKMSDAIDNAYVEMNHRDLNGEFEKYVQQINHERKLKAYTDKLKLTMTKCKNTKKKNTLMKLLETAEKNIDFLRVKYPKISTAAIFSKTELKRNDDLILDYEEGKAIRDLLLNKVIGIVAIGFLSVSMITDVKTFDIGVLLTTAYKLFQIGLSVYVGYTAGKDFAAGVMLSKLKLRLGFVQKFIESRKRDCN